jgi:uncharacterized protein (TIGR04255 family)
MSEPSSKILPDYESPPVIEVVAGITFQPMKALTGPYLGVLWEKFKPKYQRIREVAALLPVIERFDEAQAEETFPFGDAIGEIISIPRTWFETSDGNGLIQVQRDRFLHNWKKEKDTDKYPHYDYVIDNFRRCLETFEQFLEENKLGSIQLLQNELTYINHIPQGEGWTTFSDIKNVFPDFSWRSSEERFLPDPEVISWQTSFLLPDRSGRLHESIRLGKRRKDGCPVFLLELTARGIGNDKSRSAMWSWFDIAHEWIVRGFTDITGERLHKTVWRRKR